MNGEEHKITENDLLAYADRALTGAELEAVEAYLASHPDDAARVQGWQRQNETLRALYDHAAAEPVPPRLSAYRIERQRRGSILRWSGIAAAALLFLAVGGVAGWYGHALYPAVVPASPALAAEAIEAHRIYASEVIHPVEVWANEEDHLQAWLSKRLDRPLTVPDLRTDGFTLVGGRLLPAMSGPAAQFMYEDDTGRRITLYVMPAETEEETSFRFASFDRLSALFWTDETISCALVGDLPRDRLLEIARRAYRQLV